jgi:monovalent cation:H+ antiporter-2, CPA2 family
MEDTVNHAEHLIHLLAQMLLFFGISGVVVPLLQRLHITSVLGYLLCGVVIGPHGLGLFIPEVNWLKHITITEVTTVQVLGELGIIAMLFMIGMELSFQRLKDLKHYVLGLGSLQILLTTVVVALIAFQFDNGFAVSLLIGSSLALSSTAIVMQLLTEKHLGGRKIGTLCFSILLMQDLAVVPIVVLASAFAGDSTQGVAAILLQSLFIAAAAVIVIYAAGRLLMRPMLHTLSVTRSPEWLMAFTLFVVAGSACVTQSAGLSAALGAFLAGLLIAETESAHSIEVIMAPLKGILLGIFFLSIGMMIDLREVWNNPILLAVSVIGIYSVKSAIILPLCRFFHVPLGRSVKASLMLAQPGEFAFLILSLGLSSGLMPRDDAQFFLLVTALSMFVAPFVFSIAPKLAAWADKQYTPLDGEHEDNTTEPEQIVIAGFGRVGRELADILEHENIPYIAVEKNEERAAALREEGYSVVCLDATQDDIWDNVGLADARAVVIAADNPIDADTILQSVRHESPLMPVIMRAHDVSDSGELYAHGATYVIPELKETGRQVAAALLHELDVSDEDIAIVMERERSTDV